MDPWPPAVRRVDIVKGLPHPDQSVDGIYSSHALEHLYLDDARLVLRECRRVLKRGAVLRLALPDAERWARELLGNVAGASACPGLAYNTNLGAHPYQRPAGIRAIAALGSGSWHKWQPTRDLIEHLLREAGFAEIRERSFLVGDLPRLSSVETRSESFFVEAT